MIFSHRLKTWAKLSTISQNQIFVQIAHVYELNKHKSLSRNLFLLNLFNLKLLCAGIHTFTETNGDVPIGEMKLGGKESKRRALVLRSDLVISELLNQFRPCYHVPKTIGKPISPISIEFLPSIPIANSELHLGNGGFGIEETIPLKLLHWSKGKRRRKC